jgi:membrane protease YdiL (CAAX protease family)
MSEYVQGLRLILIVIAVLLRINGFILIYMKRGKVLMALPIVLNIFSPVLCLIVLPYVTSKRWEGLGRGNTFADTVTLLLMLLGSQLFSGMIFVSGLFVLGLEVPHGRAVGPAADPVNFLPIYLLAMIALSSLLLLCMLRLIMPRTSPLDLFKGKKKLETSMILYIALVPMQLLVWGYGWVMGDAGFNAPSNPFMLLESGMDFIAVFIAVVVIAPLIEEIFFRGYLFKLLQDKLGDNPAVILTSILFAAAHFNIFTFLPILVMGALMGWARKRTGSIIPSLILHMANNLIALLVVFTA